MKFTFSQQEEQQRKDIYGKLQVSVRLYEFTAPCVATNDIVFMTRLQRYPVMDTVDHECSCF